MNSLKELAQSGGLYSPEQEHDACGVGMVANIKGEKTHAIVSESLQVLDNLGHRGASGSDPDTGDGAGILVQMPDVFFRKVTAEAGISLPAEGEYGVGMVFLPQHGAALAACVSHIENVVADEGLTLLGWRDVPLDHTQIGRDARAVCPTIRQFFVGKQAANTPDRAAFERKLYVVRKAITNTVSETGINEHDADFFYVSSLSCNTVVYKGLLVSHQLSRFYLDLNDESLVSAFALVHSRFSTNTLGHWKLAHPYRYLAHNGEINTLRGNINWMHAREQQFSSPLYGDDIHKLAPICDPSASDTASFDNALELLVMTGRDLAHAMLMMIPEAWGQHETMSQEKKDFYEFHSCMTEPWDGPAMMLATDGKDVCAVLDRNGLRPFRYTVTHDDKLIMASETGVLNLPPESIKEKGRLQPGRMFLVSFDEGRIIGDEELKHTLSSRRPYGQWLKDNKVALEDLPDAAPEPLAGDANLRQQQRAFGFTIEELRMLTTPMAAAGYEAIGSMGNDASLAVLSDQNRSLFDYFKQLFAQVSNPPLDAIREELVTSLEAFVGSEQNLFEETPRHCRQLRLKSPLLTDEELARIRALDLPGLSSVTLSTLFDAKSGSLQSALDNLCAAASQAIEDGQNIIILSDRGVDADHAPIPSLLATSAVHHHLTRDGTRTRVGLVVESGEPREVQHICLLIGYGAGGINPYLALESVRDLAERGELNGAQPDYAEYNFIKANEKGILKVMSKMGISTVQSYRGAQIFEAIGINDDLIERYFTRTPSRIQGIGLETVEEETLQRHRSAFDDPFVPGMQELDMGGQYQWRRHGEFHQWNPEAIAKLQYATRSNDQRAYREFADEVNDQSRKMATLRGLLEFKDVAAHLNRRSGARR